MRAHRRRSSAHTGVSGSPPGGIQGLEATGQLLPRGEKVPSGFAQLGAHVVHSSPDPVREAFKGAIRGTVRSVSPSRLACVRTSWELGCGSIYRVSEMLIVPRRLHRAGAASPQPQTTSEENVQAGSRAPSPPGPCGVPGPPRAEGRAGCGAPGAEAGGRAVHGTRRGAVGPEPGGRRAAPRPDAAPRYRCTAARPGRAEPRPAPTCGVAQRCRLGTRYMQVGSCSAGSGPAAPCSGFTLYMGMAAPLLRAPPRSAAPLRPPSPAHPPRP